MNHAFVDASWQEKPDGRGVGGWGLVLLLPGQLPARHQGRLDAPDNNAAELRAVLEAVRAAPVGEALTVHTDNQAVIACVARGQGPAFLDDLAREVWSEAQARGVRLRAVYAPRTRRHMQGAHLLANDARKGLGSPGAGASADHAEVLIEQRPGFPEARVGLRRRGERLSAVVPLDPESEVPGSVQALLAAVTLAQPGERLEVRRASPVAQAWWLRPERALRPAARERVAQARSQADGQGVQVLFV
ncbi:Ribonuclease HI [Deinococcus reticulitermitis]|uniref:Ribonuclease HI n=1 Tax=Deinococcus reticulitermitis TaxID=856736 RepID=A0A1H7BS62_9DEIO|nr:ribonuclease H [Deinococcus reticulitermitis]SEJ77150.1 Ribonuclease HI [Deinococcus reticulitermitis]